MAGDGQGLRARIEGRRDLELPGRAAGEKQQEARHETIAADIAELSCIRFQPTADERILHGLRVRGHLSFALSA